VYIYNVWTMWMWIWMYNESGAPAWRVDVDGSKLGMVHSEVNWMMDLCKIDSKGRFEHFHWFKSPRRRLSGEWCTQQTWSYSHSASPSYSLSSRPKRKRRVPTTAPLPQQTLLNVYVPLDSSQRQIACNLSAEETFSLEVTIRLLSVPGRVG
jgi:hypothetical protein